MPFWTSLEGLLHDPVMPFNIMLTRARIITASLVSLVIVASCGCGSGDGVGAPPVPSGLEGDYEVTASTVQPNCSGSVESVAISEDERFFRLTDEELSTGERAILRRICEALGDCPTDPPPLLGHTFYWTGRWEAQDLVLDDLPDNCSSAVAVIAVHESATDQIRLVSTVEGCEAGCLRVEEMTGTRQDF